MGAFHTNPCDEPDSNHSFNTNIDMEDDPYTSLTSQTLNSDGTPKRPMNAFLIFARIRRPQIAAENLCMRTGEVSKILSREWKDMPASEKQFYQDQAKQLKESFNTKYPGYVYTRSANHAPKRRRSNASGAGIVVWAHRDRDETESSPDLEDTPPSFERRPRTTPPSPQGNSSSSHGGPYRGIEGRHHVRTASHPYSLNDIYRSSSYDSAHIPISRSSLMTSYDSSLSSLPNQSPFSLRRSQSFPSIPLSPSSWSPPSAAFTGSSSHTSSYDALPVNTSYSSDSGFTSGSGNAFHWPVLS